MVSLAGKSRHIYTFAVSGIIVFLVQQNNYIWNSVQGLYRVQSKGWIEILQLMRQFSPAKVDSLCLSTAALKTNPWNAQSL